MRDYWLYIKDMLAAIDSIESFVRGLDEQAFQEDDKTSSAVVRKLEIIRRSSQAIPGKHTAEISSGSMDRDGRYER